MNELTGRTEQLVVSPDVCQASLVDIRMDSQKYPRLCSFTRREAVFHMSKIVLMAFQYKGMQADPANVSFISTSLVDELGADYDKIGAKYITFEEIHRVVKRAVLGQGKEMFGISFASLYAVIADYIKGEGHQIQKAANEKYREQKRNELRDAIIAPMIQGMSADMLKKSRGMYEKESQ